MLKKIIAIITILAMGIASVNVAPAMAVGPMTVFGDEASENAATGDANILKECASDSNGIQCILVLVVEIMSVGVGILGVIGISVSGIQYLTAGGNEEQTRKAKRRIFEIVIGIAAYVVIYALLKWLLPSFNV